MSDTEFPRPAGAPARGPRVPTALCAALALAGLAFGPPSLAQDLEIALPGEEPAAVAPTGNAVAFTDDFSGESLSLARYTRPARSVRVLDGAVRLSVAAESVVSGTHEGSGLAYRADAPFSSTEILVQLPDDAVAADAGTSAAVRVDAALYRTGDGEEVRAAVLAGDRGAGRELWAELVSVGLGGTEVLGTVTLVDAGSAAALGELFEMSIAHDGGSGVTVAGGGAAASLQGPERADGATVDVTYSGRVTGSGDGSGAARMATTLFDPYVNDEYVDLEEVELERVRDDEAPFLAIGTADGRAVLDAVGDDRESRVASVVARHPDDAPAAGAASTVLSMDAAAVPLSADDGAARVVLRVPLHNDTYDGNWNLYEGDVVARVGLERTFLGLGAVARIERFDDDEGTLTTLLEEYLFPVQVETGTEYAVSVEHDGDAVRLGFADATVEYAVPGAAFVPWDAAVALESRLDAAIGEVTGRFDVLGVGHAEAAPRPGAVPTPVPVPGTDPGPPPAPDELPDDVPDVVSGPGPDPVPVPGTPASPAPEPAPPAPGSGADAPPADGSAVGTAPQAPDMAYALAYSTHTVELFWSAARGPVGTVYEIVRDDAVVATTDGRSFVDEGLEPGTVYDYRIVAVSPDGVRAENAALVRIATRSAPAGSAAVQGLRSEIYSSSAAELFWLRATDDASIAYEVQRDGDVLATGSMNSLMLTDLDPREGAFYEVFAVDATGDRSPGSGKLYVTTAGR